MRVFWLFTLFVLANTAQAGVVHGIGVARDASNGDIRYIEHHQVSAENYLIDYYTPDMSLLAYKRITFPGKPQHPAIEQEDLTRDSRARVEPGPDEIRMWRDEAGEVHEGSIAAEDDLIVDAGFDAYIKANWDAFQQPLERKVDFAIAGFPRTLRMRIKVMPLSDSDNIEFKVSPTNWFVHLFLPTLDLVYTNDRRLLRYKGYSNLLPEKGKGQDVVIDFNYHETTAGLPQPLPEWLPTQSLSVTATE